MVRRDLRARNATPGITQRSLSIRTGTTSKRSSPDQHGFLHGTVTVRDTVTVVATVSVVVTVCVVASVTVRGGWVTVLVIV